MVFLILSKSDLSEALQILGGDSGILWLAHGLIPDEEVRDLRAKGVSVTVFSRSEATGMDEIQDSLETIRLHHPHQIIWQEAMPEADSS